MIAQDKDAEAVVLDELVTRKILLHQNSMMLVRFDFKKGGVGVPHSHTDHEQIGYIAEGVFEVISGDEKKVLSKGDSYYAAKNEIHGVVALEDGVIIDAFTPIRDDFLT